MVDYSDSNKTTLRLWSLNDNGQQINRAQRMMRPKISLDSAPESATESRLDPEHSMDADARKHLWSISPTAFHQSFDDRLKGCDEAVLSNSCSNIEEQVRRNHGRRTRRAAFCSGDSSKGPMAASYGFSGNDGLSSGGNRPPNLGGRSPQSSFDSNGDVGQVTLNLMRVNGTMPGFKTLLASSNSPGALQRNLQGQARDSLAKISAGTPTTAPQVICGEFVKRKESLGRPRKESDAVRILSEDGEQQSKKSLSVLSDDLEGQRNIDDAKTPLVKDSEKGGRLIKRQYLYEVRRTTSDYALFFAVIGIVMMVIENELSAAHVYEKDSVLSILFKIIIVLSTGILILLVVKFHVHEVQLFMNANSAEDWRIALTWERCLQIAVELAVCSICPVPFNYDFLWTTVHSDGITVTSTWVSLDVALSIPMFFRIYWIFRVMLLHSRLFTDASSRSIAGLNRVNFNSRFILKTLMTICPGTMLLVFTASMWVMVAWILRQCERHHAGDPPISMHALKHQNYLNSLWFIAITFLSVGYGDIVPNTYCGRGMAVITGVLGTCTSSMVVAVIARKLELTRAEKHVHNFMMDTQLTKQLKHAAANVLRETWLIYKYRRLVEKIDPTKIRHHQRKFLVAIYALRKVKRDQRKLAENSVSLGDVAKTTSNTHEMIHDIHSIQEGLAVRMTSVEHQLSDIQREIGSLSELLRSQYQRRPSGNDRDSDLISVDSVRRRKHTMQQDTSYQ